MKKKHHSTWKKKGFVWVTLIFLLVSMILHWLFGWFAFKNEQLAQGQEVVTSEYITLMLRDTMENWQSEFLQLIWQVAGLVFLWYVGSPQSKESSDREEAKLDYIIKSLDPGNYEKIMKQLEEKYPKE